MSRAYVLEVEDEAVGLLVSAGTAAYQFVATAAPYGALDGRMFSAPDHALRAAYRLHAGQKPPVDICAAS